MIKFALCRKNRNQSTINAKPFSYTERELIDDFFTDSYDYDTLREFDSHDEALAAYNEEHIISPSLVKSYYHGYFVDYDIVFVQRREYDDDGEITDCEELECKTGSYKHVYFRVRETSSDGSRLTYDELYPNRGEAEAAISYYHQDDSEDPDRAGIVYDVIEEEA